MKSIGTKALQLIDKYCIILEGEQSINIEEAWSEETWNKAKQCALILVDEIIPILEGYEDALSISQQSDILQSWQQLKQEIEKL
jgi:hypothetical protein